MNKGMPLIHKIPVHSFGSLALEWESRKGSPPPTSPHSITFSRYSRLNAYSKGRHDLKANGTQMEQHDRGWRIHKESLGCTISCLLHDLQSSELWKKHTDIDSHVSLKVNTVVHKNNKAFLLFLKYMRRSLASRSLHLPFSLPGKLKYSHDSVSWAFKTLPILVLPCPLNAPDPIFPIYLSCLSFSLELVPLDNVHLLSFRMQAPCGWRGYYFVLLPMFPAVSMLPGIL